MYRFGQLKPQNLGQKVERLRRRAKGAVDDLPRLNSTRSWSTFHPLMATNIRKVASGLIFVYHTSKLFYRMQMMEIRFHSRKVQKLCNSEKEMRKKIGPRVAEKLKQRLSELNAAVTLEHMKRIPAARCHELGQDRKGQLAVDLVHPMRLIFEPDHNPIPRKADGGLDWTKVTAIVIREVVDYH